MGLRFVRDNVVIDAGTPIEESAQNSDGRRLIPYTQAIYNQDGSVDTITDRAFNPAIKLPPSGNVSKVYPSNKATESDSNANKADPARIANPLIDVQIARANNDAANTAQKALLDGELRAATNLQPIGYDQYGRVGAWQVKPRTQG